MVWYAGMVYGTVRYTVWYVTGSVLGHAQGVSAGRHVPGRAQSSWSSLQGHLDLLQDWHWMLLGVFWRTGHWSLAHRPREECEVLWWVCLSVCLSVHAHNSKTARPNFTKFLVHVARGRGLVLLRWHWHMSCTSGFVDDNKWQVWHKQQQWRRRACMARVTYSWRRLPTFGVQLCIQRDGRSGM